MNGEGAWTDSFSLSTPAQTVEARLFAGPHTGTGSHTYTYLQAIIKAEGSRRTLESVYTAGPARTGVDLTVKWWMWNGVRTVLFHKVTEEVALLQKG